MVNPVMKLIHERAVEGSAPLQRTDSHRLALVIEGGVMRGVVTAGMVAGLEHLNLLNVFDAIYGSSAGAFNGAFFAAGQAAYGTTIYYENLNSSDFICLWNVLNLRPPADLDVIFKRIIVSDKPLDWKAVVDSPIPLKVVAASVERLRSAVLGPFKDRDSLFTGLRASASLPVVAGSPVQINGERYLDALLFEPIPVHTALNEGFTHILVLLSRPLGRLPKPPGPIDRFIIAPRLERLRPGLGSNYLQRLHLYRNSLSLISSHENDQFSSPPFIKSISLGGNASETSRIEKNPTRLKAAARAGIDAMLRAFLDEPPVIVDTLIPYTSSGQDIRRCRWTALAKKSS